MFPMFIPFYLWSTCEYLPKLMSHRTESETHCISQRPLLPVTCSRLSFTILFTNGEGSWMLGSQSHGQKKLFTMAIFQERGTELVSGKFALEWE